MTVKLLYGFDTERPWGSQGETPEGRAEREANLELIGRLNGLMDLHQTRRTFFILGNYLDQSAKQLGEDHLRQVFTGSPLIEIGQHTYSHPTIAPIKTRPDKEPISTNELRQDLRKADETIGRILDVEGIVGLRAPLGYPHRDLTEHPEVLRAIKESGLRYISSSLRDKDGGINAPLQENEAVRQPFAYHNGLIEVPSHGWQDSAFTGTSRTKGTEGYPTTSDGIFDHYSGLLVQAWELSGRTNQTAYVGFCMHPWAIRMYDPNLTVLSRLLNFAGEKGFDNGTYRDAANEVLASPRAN